MDSDIQEIVEGIATAARSLETGQCYRYEDFEVHLVERDDQKLEVVVYERRASIPLEWLEPAMDPDQSGRIVGPVLDAPEPSGQSNHVIECACAACRRDYIAP